MLNDSGQIVADSWGWLSQQYPHVDLDEWIVMPNHLHGIIVLDDRAPDTRRGGSRTAQATLAKRKPLGRLVGAFKTVSTKRINQLRGTPGAQLWQRNYYEHVVRDEPELERARHYIAYNAAKWPDDPENPGRHPRRPSRRMSGGSRTAPTGRPDGHHEHLHYR